MLALLLPFIILFKILDPNHMRMNRLVSISIIIYIKKGGVTPRRESIPNLRTVAVSIDDVAGTPEVVLTLESSPLFTLPLNTHSLSIIAHIMIITIINISLKIMFIFVTVTG